MVLWRSVYRTASRADRRGAASAGVRGTARKVVLRAALGAVGLSLTVGCSGPRMFPTAGSDRASPAALHLSTDAVEPEASSGWTPRSGWSGTRQMVAAANPLATEAGLLILRAGGSAVDAAVAVQLVLTLVEPQSSGIGGGGLMLTWDGARVQAWDGRETAPAAAREDQFLTPTGRPVPIQEAVFGGRAVATPGVLRLLETVHREHGRLPWARLFEPAIRLADEGFPVGPRLHRLLDIDPLLRRDPIARTWFYRPDGSPWPVGYRLRNPALAQVLRQVAARGSAAFHEGSIARAMVRAVRQSAVPGGLSEGDLRDYQAVLRQPLCTGWLDRLTVCGFPPPSSGHLALMQILGLLAASDLPEARQGLRGEVPSAEWLHAYNEAARLAYADRAQYVADPAYVAAPGGRWEQLLDAGYLRQRAQHMRSAAARQVAPGHPPTWSERPASAPGPATMAYAPMADQPEFGTSHISIVDSRGHAVAFTTTIEASFGARVMSDGGTGLPGGFLLNNQMTDFALAPRDATGRPVANRVEPGKRPRSSMSPTLVFDAASGRLLMSTGSPGGGAIIHFTAKMLVATQQWGLDVQQAINLPNFVQINGPLLLETGRFPRETQDALRARGHTLEERDLTSGIQAIERRGSGWFGGADPRREGVVRAD